MLQEWYHYTTNCCLVRHRDCMGMILHNPLFVEAQEREEEEVRLLVRGGDGPSRNSRNSEFGGH
jgi:hypothetical protein